jgi:Xaa-Pro aminopeptidase
MASSWAEPPRPPATLAPLAARAEARRRALRDHYPADTLIVPAGSPKQRSNDTDYPYRPHTAFTYLTGWGADTVPESVLIIDSSGDTALYVRPPAGRESDEFYANAALGEFWTGPRPNLDTLEDLLGVPVRALDELPDMSNLAKNPLRVIREADPIMTTAIDSRRDSDNRDADDELAQTISEMRLVKDDEEIAELRAAIASTADGFDDIVAALPRAIESKRGERIIEGVFHTRARHDGNDVGYGTIAASGPHACVLHWVRNDGPVKPGDLLLVDAGVERNSLYTADITRTIPVGGRFTEVQRRVYEAVLAAADRAFAACSPGVTFRSIHDEAMVSISETLEAWGVLPVTAEQSRKPDAGYHRRYMIHGTSHHLGLDVHDCAQARKEKYLDGVLSPGMVFTIEPGLYFQPDDLTVDPELRGIGVRIEDNILVTEDGAANLSAGIPRTVDEVEAWWARIVERVE